LDDRWRRVGHGFWTAYYDADMEFGSEEPADPSKTTRVLTMFASKY
jgi:hypothetical protein